MTKRSRKKINNRNYRKGGYQSMKNLKENNKKVGNETMKKENILAISGKTLEGVKNNLYTITKKYFEDAGFDMSFLETTNVLEKYMDNEAISKELKMGIRKYKLNPYGEVVNRIMTEGFMKLYFGSQINKFNNELTTAERYQYFIDCMMHIGLQMEVNGADYVNQLLSMAQLMGNLPKVAGYESISTDRLLQMWSLLVTYSIAFETGYEREAV